MKPEDKAKLGGKNKNAATEKGVPTTDVQTATPDVKQEDVKTETTAATEGEKKQREPIVLTGTALKIVNAFRQIYANVSESLKYKGKFAPEEVPAQTRGNKTYEKGTPEAQLAYMKRYYTVFGRKVNEANTDENNAKAIAALKMYVKNCAGTTPEETLKKQKEDGQEVLDALMSFYNKPRTGAVGKQKAPVKALSLDDLDF